MVLVKVTRNRQITIPSKIAKKLGIRVGDYVRVVVENDRLVIEKVKGLEDLSGRWKHVDTSKLSEAIEKRWKHWSSA